MTLFRALVREDETFASIFPTRSDSAPDGSILYVYFAGNEGQEAVEEAIGRLILYKPSLRKALSQQVPARYTPQLSFKYDASFEKVQRIERLLGDIASEGGETETDAEDAGS